MQWSDRVGRRLKLRDLHIVLAVAESGSMAKAAADLAISQPSVSKAIADVEHVVGLPLFDRGPRGIEPTIYGRALANCGTAVFDELRQGVKQLEFLADPTVGALRVGCNETLAAGSVSATIEQLLREYPKVAVQVVPANRETLLNRELPLRTIDLAVAPVSGLTLGEGMELKPLFEDRFVVMAGAQKAVRRRKLTLADLIDERWVLPPPESLPGSMIADVFRAEGLEPPQAHVVSFSIPLHQHLLATGGFVTILPASMLHFGKHLSMRRLPVDIVEKTYSIGIVALKNRTLAPFAQVFIDRALKLAKSITKLGM
jgi:DNA-binding transcriptional LysR family regulator